MTSAHDDEEELTETAMETDGDITDLTDTCIPPTDSELRELPSMTNTKTEVPFLNATTAL